MKKLKIALLSPTVEPFQGWGRYTLEVCKQLWKKVHITLYLPENNPPPENLPFPVECVLPPFKKDFSSPESEKPFLSPVLKVEGDIIHSLVSFPYGILAFSLSKKKNIPYFITAHGTYGVKPLLKRKERYLLENAYLNASRVLVPSHFTGRMIEKFLRKEIRWEFLPNGVDYEKFQKKIVLPSKWKGRKVLLNVGELKPRKGQDIIIKALPIVKKYFPEIILLLIGKDSWEGYLQKLVKKLRIEENVAFLGRVPEEELPGYYQIADVFIHTPRKIGWKFEGFGIVYLEAGACGKPVVGSRSGGVEDAVIDGVTGILVPENNPSATARAILKILKDPTLSKKLGEEGRKRAKELSWERYCEKLIHLYNHSLNR